MARQRNSIKSQLNMKIVLKQYLGALLVVAVAISITCGVSYWVNPQLDIDTDVLKWVRLAAASLFAASTLGRCGWSIQTWGGSSSAEVLNLKLFKTFYVLGFCLLVLTLLLHPNK